MGSLSREEQNFCLTALYLEPMLKEGGWARKLAIIQDIYSSEQNNTNGLGLEVGLSRDSRSLNYPIPAFTNTPGKEPVL